MLDFLILLGIILLLARCFGIIGSCSMCCKKDCCKNSGEGTTDGTSDSTGKVRGDHSFPSKKIVNQRDPGFVPSGCEPKLKGDHSS